MLVANIVITAVLMAGVKTSKTNDMKTKEEMLDDYGCPEIPFDENVTMFYPAILSAMQEYAEFYHREQLSAGIKAKALRKKGTDVFYTLEIPIWKETQYPQVWPHHLNIEFFNVLPNTPANAELVNIIILEEKP